MVLLLLAWSFGWLVFLVVPLTFYYPFVHYRFLLVLVIFSFAWFFYFHVSSSGVPFCVSPQLPFILMPDIFSWFNVQAASIMKAPCASWTMHSSSATSSGQAVPALHCSHSQVTQFEQGAFRKTRLNAFRVVFHAFPCKGNSFLHRTLRGDVARLCSVFKHPLPEAGFGPKRTSKPTLIQASYCRPAFYRPGRGCGTWQFLWYLLGPFLPMTHRFVAVTGVPSKSQKRD